MFPQVFQRWRLVLKVAPFVLIASLIKVALDVLGWEPIPLSPLYTGLVGATIFLLGFLLAGTLADYKESEKLPGDLAASIETIADECLILYSDKQAKPALDCLRSVRGLAASLIDWFYGRVASTAVFDRISGLNRSFLAFEPLTQPNFIVRLKQEQSAIRRMLIRVETIRDTSFVGAGYVIAEISTFLLVAGLLLTEIGPDAEEVFLVSTVAFLFVYVIALIRDLDDPFEFNLNGSENGAAEVSLRPIERVGGRLDAAMELLGETPSDEPSAGTNDSDDHATS